MGEHPYLDILRRAAAGTLPETIDSSSVTSVALVQELIDAGHLKAIDITSLDGPGFLNCSITVSGREYLLSLEQRARDASFWGKFVKQLPSALGWVFGIVAVVVAAFLVKIYVG